MLDLGFGSLETLAFKELVYLLLALAASFVAVVWIGLDGIIAAIVVANAIAILAELLRRAWRRGYDSPRTG